MGCSEKKLSKNLTQTFMAYCNVMICQQATLSGEAERPKVADAVIEAHYFYYASPWHWWQAVPTGLTSWRWAHAYMHA